MKDYLKGLLGCAFVVVILIIIGDDLSGIFPLSLVYYLFRIFLYVDFIGIVICGGQFCEDFGAILHFLTFPISYGFIFMASARILKGYTQKPAVPPARLAKIQAHPVLAKMFVSFLFALMLYLAFSGIKSILEFFLQLAIKY